jgi:hypothetical protein
VNIPDPEELSRVLAVLAVTSAVVLLVGVFLLGALGQLAAPGPLSRGAAMLRTELWSSIGRGLAWILLVPAVGALLFAPLVGIPAGVILMAAFLVLLTLAFVTAAYASSTKLYRAVFEGYALPESLRVRASHCSRIAKQAGERITNGIRPSVGMATVLAWSHVFDDRCMIESRIADFRAAGAPC